MKKLSKRDLKKIRDRIDDIISDIDSLFGEIDMESAESLIGEALSSAQSDLNCAMGTIDEEL